MSQHRSANCRGAIPSFLATAIMPLPDSRRTELLLTDEPAVRNPQRACRNHGLTDFF